MSLDAERLGHRHRFAVRQPHEYDGTSREISMVASTSIGSVLGRVGRVAMGAVRHLLQARHVLGLSVFALPLVPSLGAQDIDYGAVMQVRREALRDRVTGLPILDGNGNSIVRSTYRLFDRGVGGRTPQSTREKFGLGLDGFRRDLRRSVTLDGQWQQLTEVVTPVHHFPGGLQSGVFFLTPGLSVDGCSLSSITPVSMRVVLERRSSTGALLAATQQVWSGNCVVRRDDATTGLRDGVEFLTDWGPTDVLHLLAFGRSDDGAMRTATFVEGTLVATGRERREIASSGVHYATQAPRYFDTWVQMQVGDFLDSASNFLGAPDQRVALVRPQRAWDPVWLNLNVGLQSVFLPSNALLLGYTLVVEWATPGAPDDVRFGLRDQPSLSVRGGVPTGAVTAEGWPIYRTDLRDSLLEWRGAGEPGWVSPRSVGREGLLVSAPAGTRLGLDALRRELRYILLEPTHLLLDSDHAGAVPSGVPMSAAYYSSQSSTLFAQQTRPLRVGVFDRSGQPIRRAGIPVSLAYAVTGSAPGGGTLEAATVQTTATGHATFFQALSPVIHRSPPDAPGYGVGYRLVPTSPGLVGQPSDPFQVQGPPSKLDVRLPQPMTGPSLSDGAPRSASILHRVFVTYLDTNEVATTGAPVTMTVRLLRGDGSEVEGGIVGERRVVGGSQSGTFVNLRFPIAGGPYRVEVLGVGVRPDTSAAFTVSAGAAAGVTLTSPTLDTSVVAGTPLALVAQVLDTFGNPTTATGDSVRAALLFVPGGGRGQLLGDSMVASVTGVSRFSALSIDKVGTYRIVVSGPAPSGVRDTSALFTVTPSAVAGIRFASQPRNGAFGVDLPAPLVAQLVDSLGNDVAQSGVTITLAKATGAGTASGTLTGTTDAQGRVAFASVQVSSGGTYTFTAAATGLTAATSESVEVTGAPTTAVLETVDGVFRGRYNFTEGANTTVYGYLPNEAILRANASTPSQGAGAFSVRVTDGSNAAVSGLRVRARVLASNGAAVPLAGDTIAATDANGRAVFGNVRVRIAGRGYRLEFSPVDFPDVKVQTNAAAPFNVITETSVIQVASIEIVQQPTDVSLYCVDDAVASGRCLSQFGVPFKATSAVTVRMRDVYGNIIYRSKFPSVTGADGAVVFNTNVPWGGSGAYGSLTNRGSAYNCGGTSGSYPVGGGSDVGFTTNSDSTVTIRFASGCVGTGRVRITSGGGDVTSAPFRTLGLPSGLAFAQVPIDGPQGQALAPAVTVRHIDAVGRTVPTTAPVTLTLVSPVNGATLSGGAATASVDGIATFSNLAIDVPGSGYALRATTAKGDTLVSPAFNISAAGATAARLVFQTQPQTIQPNTQFPEAIAVAITDAAGARVRGATDAVTLTVAQGASLSGTATVAAVDGLATFPGLTMATPGQAYTLTATSSLGGSAVTAVSAAFNVTGTTAAAVTVTLDSTHVSAGDTLAPVRVRFFDANGNRLRTGLSGTLRLRLGVNPTGATLTGTTSRIVQGDEVVFDDLWLDRAGTGYTLVAEGADVSAGTSAPITVSALSTPVSLRLVNVTAPQRCPLAPACASTQENSQTRVPPYTGSTFAQGLYFPEVEVEVLDRFGNVVPNYARSISYEFESGGEGSALLRSRPWSPGVVADSVAIAASGRVRFPLHVMTVSGFRDRRLRFFVKGTSLAATTSTSYAATGTLQYLRFQNDRLTARAGQPIEGLVLVLADSIGQSRAGTQSVQAPTGTVTIERVAGPQAQLSGTLKRPLEETADGEFVARFPDVTIASAGTDFRLRARFPGSLSTAGDAAEALELRRRIDGTATRQVLFTESVATLSPLFAVSGSAASLAFVTQPVAVFVDSVLPAVRVEVRDANGQRTAFSGSVTVSATAGGTGLGGTLTVPVEAGVAEFSTLRFASPVAGLRLAAQLPGIGIVESAPFDVRDLPVPTTLAFTAQPVGGSVNRALAGVRVAVRDATGAPLAVSDSLRVTVWVVAGDTIASGTDTAVVSVANGEAAVPSLVIPAAGQYKLKLSGLSLTTVESSPFSVTSSGAASLRFVTAKPAVLLRSRTNDARELVRNAGPIIVEVLDAQGVRVTDQPVRISLGLRRGAAALDWYPAGSRSVVAVDTATTSDGLAVFRNLGTRAAEGPAFLQATATGLTAAATDSFPVASVGLRLENLQASYPLGATWPVLTLRTIAVSGPDTTTIALPGWRAVLTPLGSLSAANNFFGTRSARFTADSLAFSDLQVNVQANGVKLRAQVYQPEQSDEFTRLESAAFDIGAAANAQAAALSWSKQPRNIAALALDTVSVVVADVYGAPISGSTYSGTVTLRIAPSIVTPAPVLRMAGIAPGAPVTATAVNGVATFAGISVDRAGSHRLIATADGLTESESQAFAVTYGPRARLRIVPLTSPVVSGQDIVLSYQFLDAAGNLFSSTSSSDWPSTNGQMFVGRSDRESLPSGVQWSSTCNATSPVWSTFNTSCGPTRVEPWLGGQGTITLFSGNAPRLTGGAGRSVLLRVWYRNGSFSASDWLSDTVRVQIASTVPTKLGFEGTPSAPGAGLPLPPVRVAIQDAGNIRVASASADVTISLTGGAPGATLGGTLTRPSVNGIATFDDLRVSAAGAGYTLRASAPNLAAGTSASFDVGTGPVALAVFDSASQRVTGPLSIAAGEALPLLRVTGVDEADSLFAGFAGTVALVVAGPLPTDSVTAEVVDGFARFADIALPRAGSYTLTARQGARTSAPVTVNVTGSGTAAQMRFVSEPTDLSSGSTSLPSITVQAEDAFGNVSASASGSVTLSLSQAPTGETLGGTVTQPFVNGVATFADLTLSTGALGRYRLNATTTLTTIAPARIESRPFAVIGGTPATLAFGALPQVGVVGAVLVPAPTVRVLDAGGSLLAAAAGTVTLELLDAAGTAVATDATITGGSVAVANGVATFSGVSVSAAGTYRLRATLSVNGADLVIASGPLSIAAQATRLGIIQQPPRQVRVRQPLAPMVRAELRDAQGRRVRASGVAVTLRAQALPPSVQAVTMASLQLDPGRGGSTPFLFRDLTVASSAAAPAREMPVVRASRAATGQQASRTMPAVEGVESVDLLPPLGPTGGVGDAVTTVITRTSVDGIVTFSDLTLETIGQDVVFVLEAEALASATTDPVTVVADVPGAPTLTAVFSRPTGAVVEFTPPASDGGAPVENYEYSISGGLTWAPVSPAVTASPLTIAGLVSGANYEVRLRAINAQGAGAASNALTVLVGAAPPAKPTVTTVTANANATLTLGVTIGAVTNLDSWQYSSDDGVTWLLATGNRAVTTALQTSGTVTPGVPLRVRVRGVSNTAGPGEASDAVDFVAVTAPLAPLNLRTVVGNRRFVMTFDASPNDGGRPITRYEYCVTEFAGYCAGQFVADGSRWRTVSLDSLPQVVTSQTNASNSPLVNNVKYDVAVRAVNAVGTGQLATDSVRPLDINPAGAPVVTAVNASDRSLRVRFTAPAADGGAAITNYEYSVDSGATWVAASPATTASPLTIAGLANGTTYFVAVRAVNAAGAGAASNVLAGTPATPPPPAAPAPPTVTPGPQPGTIVVTLPPRPDSVPAGTGEPETYTATVTPGAGTPPVPVTCTITPPATSCTIAGLPDGEAQTVTVVGTNPGGGSPPSAPSAPVRPGVPGVPGVPAVEPTDGGVRVTVVPPPTGGTPTAYTVTAQPGGATCTVTPPATSCTVPGLTNGTPYTVTVTAENPTGASAPSAPSTPVVPTAALPPGAAVLTRVAPWEQSLRVHFTAPAADGGAAITNYEYSVDSGATWVAASPATTASPLTIAGLANGTTYFVAVRAVNAAGAGAASNVLAGTPATPPPPAPLPAPPTVTPGPQPGTIVVTLPPLPDSVPAGTGEAEEYTATAQPAQESCTVVPPATTCTIGGLPDGDAQEVTVVGNNPGGGSPPSAPSAPVRPGLPGVPGAPVVTPENQGVSVTVVPPPTGGTPTSYTATAQPGGATCTVTPPATSCTIRGLTNGTPYTVTVTASNPVGTSSAGTASAPVMPLVPPSAPEQVTAGVGGPGAIRVRWAAPSDLGVPALDAYVVELSIDGGATWTLAATVPDANARAVDLSGLTNSLQYLARVAGRSSGGRGAFGTAPEPATPTPPVLQDPETGQSVEPDTGVVIFFEGGRSTTLTIEVVEERELRFRGDAFSLEIGGLGPNGEVLPIEEQSRTLRAQLNAQVQVEGTGFQPGSVAHVWIFSTPAQLGQTVVDSTGRFTLLVTVPDSIGLGRHTLQVNGVSADLAERSLSLAVLMSEELGAPGAATAVAGPGAASVAWEPPQPLGAGITVTGYVIEYRAVGTLAWTRRVVAGGALRQGEINGLEPGTAHEIRVAAQTSEGLSPWRQVGATLVPLSTTPTLEVVTALNQSTPALGDTVSITITVRNTGFVPVEDIVVSASPDSPRLRILATRPSIGTVQAATQRWTIPMLQPGTEATLVIEAVVVVPASTTPETAR